MLPVCLGEATKLSYFLLDADKVYIGTCKLGVRTSTADAEGEVIETRPVGVISEARVREVLESFHGEITQIPPMHSALKHQGQPLYKLAHQGIEVERKPRQVQIHELTLLRFAGDELEIRVHCSKGTYIRTLAEDIGAALDAFLLPMEQALDGWPEVVLSDTTLYYVRQGQAVQVPQAPTHGWVRLFSPQREFIGVGVVLDDGRI